MVKQPYKQGKKREQVLLCRPLDAAGVMESMLEAHTKQLLPRLKAGDGVLAQFAEHCLECKVRIPLFMPNDITCGRLITKMQEVASCNLAAR